LKLSGEKMMWKFRAVNNRVAKRRYFIYSLILILMFAFAAIYRVETGFSVKKMAILLSFSAGLIFLYTLISLGKERYYSMDEKEIVYKPLKTKIEDIDDFEVDEKNRVIKLKLKKNKLLAVKTLYFEDLSDMREAEVFLRKYLKSLKNINFS